MRQPPWESLPSPGVTMPGQFGPMSRVLPLPAIARFTRIMSRTGMPSVMAHHQFQPGVRAFQNRVRGKSRRNKNRGGRRAGLFHRFGDRVENRNALAGMLKNLAALAGRDAGDDLRAVINRELRVFRAKAAGDALDEDLGVGFNENGHGKIYNFGFTIYDLFRLWMQIVLPSGS